MPSQILEHREPTRTEALRSVAQALLAACGAMEAAALAISSLAVETPAPDGPDEMLTVEEAAGEIRRSPAFVRQQCKFGAIKALRDGHGWRIRRSALATYERKRTA